MIIQWTHARGRTHAQYVFGQVHGNGQMRVRLRFKCRHPNSGEEMRLMGFAFSDLSKHFWSITQEQEDYVTKV